MRERLLLPAITLVLCSIFSKNVRSQANTLDIVNWNVEWFGSVNEYPYDNDLQEANVKKVLQNLDAAIYAFSEIVDTARFGRVIRSLGSSWEYILSPYASSAADTNAAGYKAAYDAAQKIGFAYDKTRVNKLSSRAMLRSHGNYTADNNSRYWWSSGRYPFLMNADITINGITKNIYLIVIHGKANTGTDEDKIESYNRRKNGGKELKDTLDTWFSSSNLILLGDYNDNLVRTIAPATGEDTVSSYHVLVEDSLDVNHYASLTLPLYYGNTGSTTGFPSVIDNVIVSDEMKPFYIEGSAAIRNDVVALVSNYGYTTSDHYPVITRYAFNNTLPVVLQSFTANRQQETVLIKCRTPAEQGLRNIIIERSSNGRVFTGIAEMHTPGIDRQYSFTDTQPLDENYYRLKLVENNGSFTYSMVKPVHFGKGLSVFIYPNPVKDKLTVMYRGPGKGLTQITILDAAGHTVLQENFAGTDESTRTINVEKLSPGIYFIAVKAGSETKLIKIVRN